MKELTPEEKETLQLLELSSPDTIAECYDGVGRELYAHLWNDVVPKYEYEEATLPQYGDSKFYRSLEPSGTGWLRFVDEKFKDELLNVAKIN
jgi:hypothetical protein